MSMVRKFKSAKVQLTLVGDQHPKGVNRLFNNVPEQVNNDQVLTFASALEILTSEKCTGANLITTDHLNFE